MPASHTLLVLSYRQLKIMVKMRIFYLSGRKNIIHLFQNFNVVYLILLKKFKITTNTPGV